MNDLSCGNSLYIYQKHPFTFEYFDNIYRKHTSRCSPTVSPEPPSLKLTNDLKMGKERKKLLTRRQSAKKKV